MKNLSPFDSNRLAHRANRIIHHLGVIVAPAAGGFGRPEPPLGDFDRRSIRVSSDTENRKQNHAVMR